VGVDTEAVGQSAAGIQTITTLTAARGSSPIPQAADPALTDARRELRAANVQIMALQNELQAAQDDKQNIQRTLMALGMAKSESDEKAERARRAFGDSDSRIEQLSDENAELRAWVDALRKESERLLQYAQASERDRTDLLNVNETLKTLNSVPAAASSASHSRAQSRHATPGGVGSAAARRPSTQAASRSPSNQPSEAPLPTTTRAYYPTHTSVTTRVNNDGSPGGVRSPSPRVVPSHNPTVTGQLSHITDSDKAHFGGFFRGSAGSAAPAAGSSSPPPASARRPSAGGTPTRRPAGTSGDAQRVAGSPLTTTATSARYGSPAIRQSGITRPASTTRR
jgi:hypothetical protein